MGLVYLRKSAGIALQINKWDVLIIILRKILNSFSFRQSNIRGKFIALGFFAFFILMPLVWTAFMLCHQIYVP